MLYLESNKQKKNKKKKEKSGKDIDKGFWTEAKNKQFGNKATEMSKF